MRIHPALLLLSIAAAAPLSAQSLTTTFTSNAGSSSFWISPSVSFDLTVTNPAGVVVNSLAVNCPYVGIQGSLELYTTGVGGTVAGNQQNPAPGTWLLRATGSITTAGSDVAVPVQLNKPVHLAPGTHGIYIVHRGCGVRYTNGAQLTYGNGDMTLDMTFGAAQATAFTSTLNTPRIANVTINYVPATDLVDFTADTVRGSSPLLVNFANRSVVTTGVVTGYEWDFDNDGIVDSTVQNPTTTYGSCGDWSPRLRLLTTNGPIERVWPNLIAVDPLVADFTPSPASGAPMLPVQFADASTGGAVSWAWDFDGDGVTDDTTQNPSFTFGPGSYPVTLTVTNGCRSATVRKRLDVVTDSFTTNYTAATNLIAKQALAFFDLVISSTDALVVTALDVNTIVHIGQPCPIKVWLTDGTANGKQQTAGAWREVANGSGTSVGGNAPTRIFLDRPIVLEPGRTYGVAVNYLDAQAYYNSPGSTTMSHPDFTINFWGVNTATTPFTTAPTVRQWNGGLHYVKAGAWPVGAITPFAQGCQGSLGTPGMVPVGTTRPRLGTLFQVDVTNMPVGGGFVIFGFSSATSIFGPLPLDLSGFGMTGCRAHVSSDFTTFLATPTNTATVSSFFPASPGLAGIRYYMQALVLDPTANSFGGVMSDALAVVTGIY